MSSKKNYRKDSRSGALRIPIEELQVEEDLTNVATSFTTDYGDQPETPGAVLTNGKGKAKLDGDGYLDVENDGANDTGSEQGSVNGYPPATEDESETRRVEENLARWEAAERIKRKAAREGVTSTIQSSKRSSFVADVSSRASLLWAGRSSQSATRGVYVNHARLQSRESLDAVPMNDMDRNESRRPSRSLTATPSPNPSITHENDAFENHPATQSLFADPQESPFMDPLSTPEFERSSAGANGNSETGPPDRPVLIASSSSSSYPKPPPTPRPLGLPPPKTPPPPPETPTSATPLRPTSPPIVSSSKVHSYVEDREGRWWHEWICGCGEDREVDYQAGRTNPFE